MSSDKQLSGKVAVITGASGGIGAAIATCLACAGAKVVLGARRMDALEQVRAAVAAKCGSSDAVMIVQTDVAKREDVSFAAAGVDCVECCYIGLKLV